MTSFFCNFYPRSPCGERRQAPAPLKTKHEFLSTLSLRRATTDIQYPIKSAKISIHALLAESDIDKGCKLSRNNGFLSTLSLRRATPVSGSSKHNSRYFYPRSPCGERLGSTGVFKRVQRISIHALLAESDRLWTILYSCPGNFYPRSPCGERLTSFFRACKDKIISIHALLAESDDTVSTPDRPKE